MFSGSVVFFRHFTLNVTVRFSFKCFVCEAGVVLAFIIHIYLILTQLSCLVFCLWQRKWNSTHVLTQPLKAICCSPADAHYLRRF